MRIVWYCRSDVLLNSGHATAFGGLRALMSVTFRVVDVFRAISFLFDVSMNEVVEELDFVVAESRTFVC